MKLFFSVLNLLPFSSLLIRDVEEVSQTTLILDEPAATDCGIKRADYRL
jgi:hypothetical protein